MIVTAVDDDVLIEGLLVEFDDGGDDSWSWGGGYGGGEGGGSSLYNTFIRPFTDVLDTAAAVVETGVSKAQLLVGIATYGVMDLLVPFVKPKYDAMVEHDKRRMASIYQKHRSTFERTEQALTEVGGDYDGVGVFFALFPDAVITKNLAKVAAAGSEKAVKTAVDTAFDFLDAVTFNATGPATDAVRKHFNFVEGRDRRGDLLLEDDDERKGSRASDVGRVAMKVFTSPRVRKLVADSKPIKSLRHDAMAALMDTIKEASEPIVKLKGAKTLADVERVVGRKLDTRKAMDVKDVDKDALAVADSDVAAAVEDVLPGLIEQAAQPFVRRLERLRGDITKLAGIYDVSDDPAFKAVERAFEGAFSALEAA